MKPILRVRTEEESNYKAIYVSGKTFRFTIRDDEPITELIHPEFYDVKVTSFCEGNCHWCVPPGTMISTPNGVIPIEDIVDGDDVLGNAYPEIVIQKTEQLFERCYDGDLIELELEDGKTLSLTPEHEVYTNNRGWVLAKDLTMNDDINIVN